MDPILAFAKNSGAFNLWNFTDSGFDVLVTDPASQNAATWYKCTDSIDYPNEICSQLNLALIMPGS
ncbi:hypothetical protein [Methyloglobulus sp.]|uniref:hypothetical protein n=1 Tax=Methyloglobulus sp. TaxID=2518622 RepID=UPI0032B7F607